MREDPGERGEENTHYLYQAVITIKKRRETFLKIL